MDLEEVLEGGNENAGQMEQSSQLEGEQSAASETGTPTGDEAAASAADTGATPGAEEGDTGSRQVPLQALLSERDKRQEMERKLAAIEAQLNNVAQQQTQVAKSKEDEAWTEEKILEDIPGALKRLEGGFEQRLKAERYNSSEYYAKKTHADYDDVIAKYTDAARANKYLANMVDESPMPALTAYEATKEWIEKTQGTKENAAASAEIEALKQELARLKAQVPDAQVPQSLATARGSGAAVPSGGAWTGPPSIEDIFG